MSSHCTNHQNRFTPECVHNAPNHQTRFTPECEPIHQVELVEEVMEELTEEEVMEEI